MKLKKKKYTVVLLQVLFSFFKKSFDSSGFIAKVIIKKSATIFVSIKTVVFC